MPRYALLLRGINVGGNKLVPMAELRALIEREGFAEPRTLLNSGNAVFQGRAAAPAALARRFEKAIEKLFGFDVGCVVRTAPEWTAILAANPFPGEAKKDPGHLLMVALDAAPRAGGVESLRRAIVGRETVQLKGQELWAYYPDGAGRSKLTLPLIEKHMGTHGTARNWNTVVKISEMLAS
jgi:uncharacterized protein (DUF1697 family)